MFYGMLGFNLCIVLYEEKTRTASYHSHKVSTVVANRLDAMGIVALS